MSLLHPFIHKFASYTWYILYMSKTYLFVHKKDERATGLSTGTDPKRNVCYPLDLLLCRCKNAFMFSQRCCIYERGFVALKSSTSHRFVGFSTPTFLSFSCVVSSVTYRRVGFYGLDVIIIEDSQIAIVQKP